MRIVLGGHSLNKEQSGKGRCRALVDEPGRSRGRRIDFFGNGHGRPIRVQTALQPPTAGVCDEIRHAQRLPVWCKMRIS